MFFFDYWTVFSTLIQFIHELAPRSLWFSVCNKPPYGALRLPLSDSVERDHQPPLIFAQYFKNVRATIKMIWMVSSVSSQTMPQSNITVICSKFGEYPQRLFCLSLDYKEVIKLEIPSQSGKTSLRCGVMFFFFFKKMGFGHAYNKIKCRKPNRFIRNRIH